MRIDHRCKNVDPGVHGKGPWAQGSADILDGTQVSMEIATPLSDFRVF